MVHLYYILPITGLDEEKKNSRQRLLEALTTKDTEIKLVSVERGPKAIESEEDEEEVIPVLIDFVKKNEEKFDAAILGCFGDPGLRKLRTMTDKLIVGPGRCSLAFATSNFDKFSIVTISKKEIPRMRNFVRRMGLKDHLESVISVDLAVLDITYKPNMAIKVFKEKTKKLETPVIVPGCMGFAFLFAERKIRKVWDSVIVNPLTTAIRFAEVFIK